MSVAGGYGFDGPYGGYNFGAPSYAPPPGAWPTQPSRQQGYGGAAFMQPSNLYGGAPQHVGGYGGFRGPAQGSMNIPAGAMYNGRPINNSNAATVFNSSTPARPSQSSASRPAPAQKTNANGYASYTQANPPYTQKPYVVPQSREAAKSQQQAPQPSVQQTPQRSVQQQQQQVRQQQPQPQQKQQRPQQQPPQPMVRQQQQPQQVQQQPMMHRQAPTQQRQQQQPPTQQRQQQQPQQQQQYQDMPQHRRAQQPTSYAPPTRERPSYMPEREQPSAVSPAGERKMSASAQAALAAASTASTASSAPVASSATSTYSTGIKLREVRGVGLQVMRLTQGSSAMLSGQIAEGDLLTRIQNYKIPAYGYNLAEIRDLLAGARGSRITLGFTSNYGNAYEVDLVRNVRSTKKPGSAYGSQRAARPASWQVQGDNMAPPPLYEGFQGGSLAGGSVVDADSFTPSIAIGDMGEEEL